MFLIIDNSEEGVVEVTGIQNGKLFEKKYKANKNAGLAEYADKFLKSLKLTLKKIQGVGVVNGANSFTSSRLAATFGNTLAYALKVPVIALEPGWKPSPAFVLFKKAKLGRYIAPKYSGEARVTIKK